jgi:hypothetical protein
MDLFEKIAKRIASNYKRQRFTCKGNRWKVPDLLNFIKEQEIELVMYPVAPLYERVSTSPEGYFDEPFESPEFIERAMKSDYNTYPVVLFDLPDKIRIADGNHRVYKAFKDGAEFIPAYVLSEEQVWQAPHAPVEESASD